MIVSGATHREDKQNILVVEDDRVCRMFLEEVLQQSGYHITSMNDGIEAWEYLLDNPLNVDVIVTDRLMPHLDGMQLFERIKHHPLLRDVPVIMQTGANTEAEIQQGIEAGVYYYLTKPYEIQRMLGLVTGAMRDRQESRAIKEESRQITEALKNLRSAEFAYRTPQQARQIAAAIAVSSPHKQRLSSGLIELMMNAVEHGNLQLGFEKKTELMQQKKLEQEIAARLSAADYVKKEARIYCEQGRRGLAITIEDKGEGFDWKPYLTMNTERATLPHGRGIAKANRYSFDQLEYLGSGNQLRAQLWR